MLNYYTGKLQMKVDSGTYYLVIYFKPKFPFHAQSEFYISYSHHVNKL